jgi:hypothetical protein
VEEVGPFCSNCNHSFEVHEQSVDGLWYCDFEDEFGEYCDCTEFYQKATGMYGDEIEVPYTSDSYKWN